MNLGISTWQGVTLLLAFVSFTAAFAKVLLAQVEKRQDERAQAQDQAREAGQKAMRELFAEHLTEERRNAVALQTLERDFLRWQADLPIQYVRREDYVRGQSVIEAKLDALYAKLELVQLKGVQHHV